MPKGPRGEKRPADAIGLAVLVGRIATGEEQDTADEAKAARRAASKSGGAARAEKLSPDQMSAIARTAAAARWKKGS